MTRHVIEWLGAYQDGELSQARCQLVEAHLEDCAACRAELEALRGLSALVRQEPAPSPSLSRERFAAQVGLRLPRSSAQPGWRPALRLGWQALPALLVGGWAFVQALGIVAGLVMLALWVGLGGQSLSQALAAPAPLTSLSGMFDLPLTFGLPLEWGWIDSFALLLALQFGAALVVCLLLGGWLAGWWVSRREQVESL